MSERRGSGVFETRPLGGDAQPEVAVLGYLALVSSVVALFLAATYFLSLLAYLAGAVAAVLAVISITDRRSRALGLVALLVVGIAVSVATLVLVRLP